MSKKSVLRNMAYSSSEGAACSSSGPWGGDGWFRFAMYWDTLGPRWPLYDDMSSNDAPQLDEYEYATSPVM
jgi:hypothetical protein